MKSLWREMWDAFWQEFAARLRMLDVLTVFVLVGAGVTAVYAWQAGNLWAKAGLAALALAGTVIGIRGVLLIRRQ